MNDNDDDQKPVEENKQPGETDRKSEAPLSREHLEKLDALLNRPIASGSLNDEVTFQKLWALFLAGNPFYLISAGLILYASTVVSDTANIWLETGIPIGILAGYTVLCGAGVIFWGLLFFAAAFLISLWKGGILQRKASEWCGPVFHFFREKP